MCGGIRRAADKPTGSGALICPIDIETDPRKNKDLEPADNLTGIAGGQVGGKRIEPLPAIVRWSYRCDR
jgi:hypothetical protein